MAEELRRALATNMRRARLRLGFSQDELAARCGLHRTYIGGVERAERNITLSTLEKVARALMIDPLWLLKVDNGEKGKDRGAAEDDAARQYEG